VKSAKRNVTVPVLAGWLPFGQDFDLHVWGRNCDRTVERSPALEALDQGSALRLGHAMEAHL
jgi:hypothetical protein